MTHPNPNSLTEKHSQEQPPVYDKICYECGSSDVLADAYAVWNLELQMWEIASVYDKESFCNACDGETRIVDDVKTA